MTIDKTIRWLSGTFLFVIVVLVSLIAPIDFTPLEEQSFYHRMMGKLDTIPITSYNPTQKLNVGWSQFSIVPDHPVPMAGYKPRANFKDVHDTLYARVLAIDNGAITAYIITVDLLLFPPELKELIYQKSPSQGSAFIYFSASHTHTGVGGWDPTILGTSLMGDYEGEWMEEIAGKIVTHMDIAKNSMSESVLYRWEADATRHVVHRIDKSGASMVDGELRGLSVVRDDSTKALLFTYGVHPTLISRKGTSLSGDYPAVVLSELQKEYQYTQFLAGMMGSHGIKGLDVFEFSLTDSIGKSLAESILTAEQISVGNFLQIKTGHAQIEHGPSQLRLSKDFKVRNWVFSELVGPLNGEIDVLKIGEILFLGTSCDFSGEISKTHNFEEKAAALNTKLIVTSFNGAYTGYITEDSHYPNSSHEEVRALNWVGPFFGEYYARIIEKLMERSAEE